jgi:cobalt-zinc-cadmium efflux system protein
VIATALGAIAINAFVILALRGDSRNLNLRAALLHVIGDVAASAGVVVAGVVILLTGWLYIDPILSLGIAALIAYGAWGIARETLNLLMEGTPPDIDLGAVTAEIQRHQEVRSVHDLHVWALASESVALSAHVVTDDQSLAEAEHLMRDIEQGLCERFAIGHTTIQVESCHPCGEIHHGAGDHNHPHAHVTFTSGRPVRPPSRGSS